MLLTTLAVDRSVVTARTGWEFKPEGACKGPVCVPLPGDVIEGEVVHVERMAGALGLPLVAAPELGLWALGPESGRALTTAEAPNLVLPDLDGREFALSSLRGRKVILAAWASW